MSKVELGQRFGRLVAEKIVQDTTYRFVCRCDCGGTREVAGSNLKKGHVRSCGCLMKEKSAIGKRIGHAIVTERVDGRRFKCLCDCGNTFLTSRARIDNGKEHTSCGCITPPNENDLTGRSFDEKGKTWRVIRRKAVPLSKTRWKAFWVCLDEDGNIVDFPAMLATRRWMYTEMRLRAIAAYGGRCTCRGCTESNPRFLTLDHVNNDGNKHRRSLKTSNMYAWAASNGFPPILQLHCWNCNMGKAIYGKCPHELSKPV